MKAVLSYSLLCFLSACSFSSHQQEIHKAEQLVSKFNCLAVNREDVHNSVLGSYHYNFLMSERANITKYIRAYKDGNELFDVPLDQVVQQKLEIYQETCKSIGGILDQ